MIKVATKGSSPNFASNVRRIQANQLTFIPWFSDRIIKSRKYVKPYKCQPRRMVKHTQTIRRLLVTNCLSMFDQFVGLTLKGLISEEKLGADPLLNLTTYRRIHRTMQKTIYRRIHKQYRERCAGQCAA